MNEGLRLTGASHRFQRVALDRALHYNEHVIPAGTPVSMPTMLTHHNTSIFPSPQAFVHERWLDNSARSTGSDNAPKRLDGYLVPFSKGTRAGMGLNLALAELYMALASGFGGLRWSCGRRGGRGILKLSTTLLLPFPV